MKMTATLLAATVLTAMFATAAPATTFTLDYTTLADATSPTAIALHATIEADLDIYTGNSYVPTSITGTRGGLAITGFDDFSEFYFPPLVSNAYPSGTYLDGGFANLIFTAGGVEYNVSRNGGSPFYLETGDGVGRQILAGNFSLTQDDAAPAAVPEPASWAMMIGGFGMIGAAMRRRSRKAGFA